MDNFTNVYLANTNTLLDSVLVYESGLIIDSENHKKFREYIVNDVVYVAINGVRYNKAKLIYDSFNKNNLPLRRYKVISSDPLNPTKNNIFVAGIKEQVEFKYCLDNFINIIYNQCETQITLDVLVERLVNKKYQIIDMEENNEKNNN